MGWFKRKKEKVPAKKKKEEKRDRGKTKAKKVKAPVTKRAKRTLPEVRRPLRLSYVPDKSMAAKPVETKKYFPPEALPSGYGDNHIYLMIRDPYWIYAYWEIREDYEKAALNQLGGKREDVKSILRVYNTSDSGNRPIFFNIDLQGLMKNWYIQVDPNCSYIVEIGLLHREGRFLPLARSNEVTTPRAGMSEVLDEHWMGIDFEKMYALSGGFEAGKSSQELRKLMEERLFKSISSGSGAGASPVRK